MQQLNLIFKVKSHWDWVWKSSIDATGWKHIQI